MKLFNKRSQPAEPSGRRRPDAASENRMRGSAFSYHAQRSSPADNIGRTTEHITPRSDDNLADGVNQGRSLKQTAGLVMAVIAVAYLTLIIGQPAVTLQSTGSSVYFLQDVSVYERTVQKVVNGSILNANKVTLDTTGIEQELLRTYPEIAAVTIRKSILTPDFTVTVIPQQPALVLTTPDNAAFLVDTNGRALIPTSQITDSGELSVPTLHDTSGLPVKTGSQALPRSVVSFVTDVAGIFKAKDITIGSLTLPRAASQLDVAVSGTPYFIKFNLQEGSRQQIGTYLAVRDRLRKEKVVPSTYIDVRVSERAYYK